MEVRRISPELTHRLRHLVLWPHIHDEDDCVIDIDHRQDAFHLGTYDGDRLVAVGSFFCMSTTKLGHHRQYRLRAMATDPEYRGRGAGRLLVLAGITTLSEMNADVIWCDARLHATGFYRNLGFHLNEEIYEVKNIGPHQFMWIEIPGDTNT